MQKPRRVRLQISAGCQGELSGKKRYCSVSRPVGETQASPFDKLESGQSASYETTLPHTPAGQCSVIPYRTRTAICPRMIEAVTPLEGGTGDARCRGTICGRPIGSLRGGKAIGVTNARMRLPDVPMDVACAGEATGFKPGFSFLCRFSYLPCKKCARNLLIYRGFQPVAVRRSVASQPVRHRLGERKTRGLGR